MIINAHRKQNLKTRLIILSISTIPFLVGFIINATSNWTLYQIDLDVVPTLQTNSFLGSHGFMTFMNVMSTVFNPMFCAGYAMILYLVSYRKLEILVFLMWFFFLSFLLSLMKQAFHQPRPYWIAGSGVQMLDWTCYSEYGMPSGHSMLAIVILEFFLRFFARVHHFVSKYIGFFYVLVFVIQLLVMFSRVMLGMHSFNQVLFGLMIGLYTLIPYYLFVEDALLTMCLWIFKNPKSIVTTLVCLGLILFTFIIEILVTFLPHYDNAPYWAVIEETQKCSKVKLYDSFELQCLQNEAIIMAAFGAIMGMSVTSNPQNLAKMLGYSRFSWKFILRFFLTIAIAFIPLAMFMNPGWDKINLPPKPKALLGWACQNVGFFFGIFFLVAVGPMISNRLNLQEHKTYQNYKDYCQFEVIGASILNDALNDSRRQTEMTKLEIRHENP